jgi:hypothetical protein
MKRVDGTLIDRMSKLHSCDRSLTNRSKAALNQFVRTLDHEVRYALITEGRLINSSSIDHHQQ